jgi:hypothetical protein
VSIKIVQSPSNNGQVMIQPSVVIQPPNANLTNIAPAGTTSQVITTFTTPKLTR